MNDEADLRVAPFLTWHGFRHAWRPVDEDGRRETYCGQTATIQELAEDTTRHAAPPHMACYLAHGDEVADQAGPAVHRAPDPDGVDRGRL